MLSEQTLYELACNSGEEPDWKAAYKQAFEVCQAQRERIAQLEDAAVISPENAVRQQIDAVVERLGSCSASVKSWYPDSVELYSEKLRNGVIRAATFAECVSRAIAQLDEQEAESAPTEPALAE